MLLRRRGDRRWLKTLTGLGFFVLVRRQAMTNEVSASNQESVSWDSEPERPGGSRDPQYSPSPGSRKLRIITSVDPTIAAKPKLKHTKKPPYKRD